MLSKDEELRLGGCLNVARHDTERGRNIELTNETILWLAEKLKEVNDELKASGSCTGTERHKHWSQDFRSFFWHSHSHTSRKREYNEYHHHSPTDHRRGSAPDNNLS